MFDMKWRILISTLFIPLVFVLLAAYTIYKDGDSFRVYVAVLFLVIVIVRIPLSDKKYLLNLTVTSSTLEIRYYTSFLTVKSLSLSIPEIKDVDLSETYWLAYHKGTLDIILGEDYFRFLILRREQLEQLRMSLAAIAR
jgi:hypothetical protein